MEIVTSKPERMTFSVHSNGPMKLGLKEKEDGI